MNNYIEPPSEKDSGQQIEGATEDATEDTAFDRQAFLKEVRGNILKNMDLPEGTRPENVMRLLAIKEKLKKIQE